MTWLSRLLPQSPGLPRLADHNHRTRQGQRRRRMSTLETLEGRTLLSNVVTSFTHDAITGANTLTISGDAHNDAFSVTENSNGTVTLVGTPAPSSNPHLPPLNTTQINGLPVGLAYTTSQAVLDIVVNLPGSYNNTDYVSITGNGTGTLRSVTIVAPGVATSGVAGLDLNLTVTNLTVAGPFALYDAPTSAATGATPALPTGQMANAPAGYMFPTTGINPAVPSNNLGGQLIASINGSHFSSLYVEQDGCCLANVSLNNDAVSGSVTVEEGVYNGDIVSVTNSTLGATTITQGYGPAIANCNGTGDSVSVQNDPQIFDLAITQLGAGGGESILVGTQTGSDVEVGLTGFGITATQDDAGTSPGNVITIESITVYGHSTNSFLPSGPPSIITSQGNDGGDSTTIDSSTVWGNISVTQGTGTLDSVYIANDTAGYTTMLGPYITPEYGLLQIVQGDGAGDSVTVNSAGSEGTAPNVFNCVVIIQSDVGTNTTPDTVLVDSTTVTAGNISVTQGDAAGDSVVISADSAGYTTPNGPIVTDHYGLLKIVQGNGYEDYVELTSVGTEFTAQNVFNNVLIIQGESLVPSNVVCTEPTGDVVSIDGTTINSNLFIFQNVLFGEGSTDADPVISGDGPGLGNNVVLIATTTGLPATADQVVVGEWTYIYQGGANNTVVMGGSGDVSGTDFETSFLDIYTGDGGGGFVSATNTTVYYGSALGNNSVVNGGGTGNTYVQKTTPVLTWANPADITYGTALGGPQLDATTSVPGSYAYTPAAGTVLSAGANETLSVTFTPTDTADYNSVTTTATINVHKATPVLTWANPAGITYGTALGGTQLDATTSVPGIFVYTPAAGTVLSAGANETLSVTFTPTDTADYNPVTATATINVQKATPVLTWANPAGITYGTALGGTQLDATTTVPGSFVYTPAAGTVLSAGAYETLSVRFTPTDTTDYGPVTATAMINVHRATLLITAKSATRVYGQKNPTFTVTYAGLTNGDLPSSLGGSLNFSTAATASSPVNTYSVVPGGLTSLNYAITFAGGKLVVTPAPLTITANNQSRVYGQPNPPWTVYYQGFVNGDTPKSLTAPVVLSTPAVLDSFAGSYPIFVGGAASPNYAIRFVSGTLAIMPPTDPVVLGRVAFVTSLYSDLLLRSPGPTELFSWLQQLGAGESAPHVASAINQSPERRALLRSHHGVGISFAVALQRAVKAKQQAIQNARRALKLGHH